MTQSAQESAWPGSEAARDFWNSTQPAPMVAAPATAPASDARQRRPAAALAADVNELLESMARKRVPRLEAVRSKLQAARAGLEIAPIEEALQGLHAATMALDILAGRSGGEQALAFVEQGQALARAGGALHTLATAFLARHAVDGPVARLLWIDLVLESDSLHKRVRQGVRWLAEMDRDLVGRRRAASTEVMARAIQELARRAHGMHERLQTVHRLCVHARAVHRRCEQLVAERDELCATLQDKVLPASARLQDTLQPLLQAAVHRALLPGELVAAIDARHELQVVLTQSMAHVLRLRDGDQDLASQLAWMEDKARRLT